MYMWAWPMCVVYVHMYVFSYVSRCQRRMLGILLCHSFPYSLETGSPTDHWAWDRVSHWSLSLRQGLPWSWSCDGSQQALVILQPPYVIVLELQVCVHQCPAFYLDASVWTCLHVSSASMLAHTHWIISPTPRIESFMKNVFAKWIYKF